jgi:hypothetical protein
MNEVYSKLGVRRRYEVWFVRLGLSDGSGALWVRYLLMNPGRAGCAEKPGIQPVQVWAAWFARGGKPIRVIEGFTLDGLELSERGCARFHFSVGENAIGENWCRGRVRGQGEEIAWELRYRSSCRVEMSSKGWIGFSRTPHLDAVFDGEISVGGKTFRGKALAAGVQGHNCGYRHRKCWTWMHANFGNVNRSATAFEALCYEMPLGLVFRKAVLWHEGRLRVFQRLQESARRKADGKWTFEATDAEGTKIEVEAGGESEGIHRIEYAKTNCSGSFEVANNSLTRARIRMTRAGGGSQEFATESGAVVEMAGE